MTPQSGAAFNYSLESPAALAAGQPAGPSRRLRLVCSELLESKSRLLLRDSGQLAGVLQALSGAKYEVESVATLDFVDRYCDTADWELQTAGWSLRWRDASGTATLDLRSLASPAAAGRRVEEFEQPVDRNLSLADVPLGLVTARLREIVPNAELQELFRAHHYRRLYLLRNAGTLIEMAIEQVTITCPSPAKHAPGTLRFDELELTLKEASAEALEELATRLQRSLQLVPARLNVYERGLQAAGMRPPSADEAPLGQSDLAIQLAYRHLQNQFQELLAEEPRAWEGLDSEGVHQMRVATRRLRAAFRAFAIVLPARPIASFNAEFRWLARVLGAVRDLDVQQENLERQTGKMPPEDVGCLQQYRRHLADQWRRARRQLLTSLESVRYRQLIERFTAFLERGPSQAAARITRDVTVGVAAVQFVDEQLKKVLNRGRRLTVESTSEQYHDLRIQGKRLRYLFEFFAPVYGEALAPFIRRLKQLQELLGEVQDAHVATTQLRQYADQVPVRVKSRRLLISLGQLISVQLAGAATRREEFHQAWREFDEQGLRRRIRRVLLDRSRSDAA